jgi:hypothetical protein
MKTPEEDPLDRLIKLRQAGIAQDPMQQLGSMMQLFGNMQKQQQEQEMFPVQLEVARQQQMQNQLRVEQMQQQPLYALAEMMTRLMSTLDPRMINSDVAQQPFRQLGLEGLFRAGQTIDPVSQVPSDRQQDITGDTAALLELRQRMDNPHGWASGYQY